MVFGNMGLALTSIWPGKTFNGVDFVQHRHRQNFSNTGDRLQAKQSLRIIDLGRAFDMQFKLADLVLKEIGGVNVKFH